MDKFYVVIVVVYQIICFAPASGSAGLKQHSDLQNISVPKNGFVYIYCSNESPVDVYFDNLQVKHRKGPLLEETHYYPFGLTMAGISSKAAGSLTNKTKFNAGSELESQEFSDGSGLEIYDTHFRQLDPQLGRWCQIDPKPDESVSPYSAMGNNPVFYNDPLGDVIHYKDGDQLQAGLKMIKDKLGGMYEIKTTQVKDEYGYTNQATLVKTKNFDEKKLTTEQKNFVTEFNKVVGSEAIARQEFVDGKAVVMNGDFKTNKVDIGDIKAYDVQKAALLPCQFILTN